MSHVSKEKQLVPGVDVVLYSFQKDSFWVVSFSKYYYLLLSFFAADIIRCATVHTLDMQEKNFLNDQYIDLLENSYEYRQKMIKVHVPKQNIPLPIILKKVSSVGRG